MKLTKESEVVALKAQPPSGGCVLKLDARRGVEAFYWPAAFGRLCVETFKKAWTNNPAWASRLRAAVC